MDLSKLYQTQISFTEWLQHMGHKDAEAHRKEDNDKRERLAVLNDVFGLPFDRPTQFPASELVEMSPRFVTFLETRGDELCALRLIPSDVALPKLRTRGASIRESMKWFVEQGIDASKYTADFVPHDAVNTWSTIFIVNHHGVFGQIIAAGHNQLTQGFYESVEPRTFSWDFQHWSIEPSDDAAIEHLKTLLAMIYIPDLSLQQKIKDVLNGDFPHDYLCGYFETTTSEEFGTWFKDYNRIIGADYADVVQPIVGNASMTGQIGSKGIARGTARIILAADLASPDLASSHLASFSPTDIIVTDMTTPAFLPLMMKAGGVVTQFGGILSHAAIVCRELGKPCVTNVKGLIDSVKDGEMIEVNAETGSIRLL